MAWFDLAGKIVALNIRLAERSGELRDALKTVEYWKQIAGERFEEIRRLNADVNEARTDATRASARNLIPPVASSPLGSRDRANALRLAAENASLRAEVERLEIALKEGNPS